MLRLLTLLALCAAALAHDDVVHKVHDYGHKHSAPRSGYLPYYAPYPFYNYPRYHGFYPGFAPHYGPYYGPYPGHPYGVYYPQAHVYHGEYKGSCKGSPDGLFWNTEDSFVWCSNGHPAPQKCPKGTKNPPQHQFQYRRHYLISDFCSVNLLAHPGHPHQQAFYPKKTKQVAPKDTY